MKRLLALVAVVASMVAVAPSAHAQSPTWQIDATHSELSFRIRHYLTRVRGTFGTWSGSVMADPSSLDQGKVAVTIDAKSIDTNNERRDNHLRSNEFFATDSFPTLSFTSSRVEVKGETIKVFGNLSIRGITKPVVLEGTYNGVVKDAGGKDRIGFEASTTINRVDHNVTWNRALEGGGAMLGDEVEINIQIEAVRQ